MRGKPIVLSALVAALTLPGCGEDACTSPPTLRVGPPSLVLGVGTTATIAATAETCGGDPIDRSSISASSSDPSIVSISRTASGFEARAVDIGTTSVTVAVEGVTETVTVTVGPGEAASVQFTAPADGQLDLTSGETFQTEVVVADAQGNETSDTPSFSTSDSEVVSVSGSGLISAQLAGVATVNASVAGVQATLDVTVAAGPASSLVIVAPAGDTVELASGASIPTTVEVSDAFGNLLDDPVAYSSTDPQVASVSSDGVVVGSRVGTAAIIAASGSLSDSIVFAVIPGAPTSVAFTDPADGTLELPSGTEVQLSVSVTDATGNAVAVTPTFSTSNTDVASVDGTGSVQGLLVGSTWVTASVDELADSILVNVAPGPVSAVRVAPSSVRLTAIGQSATVTAEASDAQGNPVPAAAFAWTVGNSGVASVSSASGAAVAVTGVSNGIAQLTVTSGSAQAFVTVTVDQTAATVTLSPDTTTLSGVGATVDLGGRLSVADANGNSVSGATPTWSSLAPGVATVDAIGRVTSTGAGTTGVVATVDGVSDTVTVSVVVEAVSLSVTPRLDTLDIGATATFTATAVDGNGSTIANPVLTCSTPTPLVLTLDAQCRATAAGEGLGTVTFQSDAAADTAYVISLGNSILATAFADGELVQSYTPGQEFTVSVRFDMSRVSANGDLGSAQFELSYDPQVLEVVSAVSNASFTGQANSDTPGVVSVAVIATNPQGAAAFDLASVVFQVRTGVSLGAGAGIGLDITAEPSSTAFAGYGSPLVVVSRTQSAEGEV